MNKVFDFLGGRKMTMILLTIALVACRKWLDFDVETMNRLIVLAIGGAGVVAVEDAAIALGSDKKKKKTAAKKK